MQSTETTRHAVCVRRKMATRLQNIRISPLPSRPSQKIWYRITRRQRFGPLVPPAPTLRTKFRIKWPIFFPDCNQISIFTKVSDIKRHGIRPVRGALWHAGGRTDRRTYVTKVTGSFDDCAKVRKTEVEVTHMHSCLEILCHKQEWIRMETKFLLKNLGSKIYF